MPLTNRTVQTVRYPKDKRDNRNPEIVGYVI